MITVIAITILETKVSTPALKFTAVREKEPAKLNGLLNLGKVKVPDHQLQLYMQDEIRL
jgi:hypothetical protein